MTVLQKITCFTAKSQFLSRLKVFCYVPKFQISVVTDSRRDLWKEYHKLKNYVDAQPLPEDQNPTNVFVNNELDLNDIDVYGFDYDYTLASYTPSLHPLIYNLGTEVLINDLKYPKDIANIKYNPNFAVRGLHVDIEKGLLLKIDSFHNVQLGTVYRGLRKLSKESVEQLYNGTHVSIENMPNFYGTASKESTMSQLMDLFAVPEITLYANVIEFLVENQIPYSPEYVFYDVKTAINGLHVTGSLHSAIMENLDLYLGPKGSHKKILELLTGLAEAEKKLFLITNSAFNFIEAGMNHMIGPDWRQLFDVVVVNARKPKFFNETTRTIGKTRTSKLRPFRRYDTIVQKKSWSPVYTMKKGEIYSEGNHYDLREMTGWYGGKVLYFGDHVYADLADATLKHGWRTGAIIPELETEIECQNSTLFKSSVRWKLALEGLIQNNQIYKDAEHSEIIQEWIKERNQLSKITKNILNPQFGSIFRTHANPTYFTRRLNRFADIYTSSLENLLNYSPAHTFYPRRYSLPHESTFKDYISNTET